MAQDHARPEPPLFADPSANRARERFAQKPRALTDKLTTVAEAVSRLIHDGDYLAIGGFGADRLPTAVCHEIVRQRKQDLRFAGHTATHDFQILAAGNLTGEALQRTVAAPIEEQMHGLPCHRLSRIGSPKPSSTDGYTEKSLSR